jgi:hypothetical protein
LKNKTRWSLNWATIISEIAARGCQISISATIGQRLPHLKPAAVQQEFDPFLERLVGDQISGIGFQTGILPALVLRADAPSLVTRKSD